MKLGEGAGGGRGMGSSIGQLILHVHNTPTQNAPIVTSPDCTDSILRQDGGVYYCDIFRSHIYTRQ